MTLNKKLFYLFSSLTLAITFIAGCNSTKENPSVVSPQDAQKNVDIENAFTMLHAARSNRESLEQLRRTYDDIIIRVLADPMNARKPRAEDLFEALLSRRLSNQALAVNVLGQQAWFDKPQSVEWAEKIVFWEDQGALSMLQTTLATDLWANVRGAEVIRFAIGRKFTDTSTPSVPFQYCDQVIVETLGLAPWLRKPDLVLELIETLILTGLAKPAQMLKLLQAPAFSGNPIATKLIEEYGDLLLSPEPNHAGGVPFFKRLLRWFRVRTVTQPFRRQRFDMPN